MTEKDPSYQDLANYEDWAEIQLYDLIDEALRRDHVQFGGKSRFSNMTALYALIERLSNNLINHFGTETVESVIDKLNVFQTVITNLEKFRYR